jgi:hypothetical protein
MHVWDFAGLCRVDELQCVSGADGLPTLWVADVDGFDGGESAAELIGATDPVEPTLPPAG